MVLEETCKKNGKWVIFEKRSGENLKNVMEKSGKLFLLRKIPPCKVAWALFSIFTKVNTLTKKSLFVFLIYNLLTANRKAKRS